MGIGKDQEMSGGEVSGRRERKRPSNFRLTKDVFEFLEEVSEISGLTKTAVVEMILRREMKEMKVKRGIFFHLQMS